ncbi:MAG: glycosyltransferase [Opitutales bacterium]
MPSAAPNVFLTFNKDLAKARRFRLLPTALGGELHYETPRYGLSRTGAEAVVGWPGDPFNPEARAIARGLGMPFLLVHPGPVGSSDFLNMNFPALSFLLDEAGILAGESGQTSLERGLNNPFYQLTETDRERVRKLVDRIRNDALGPVLNLPDPETEATGGDRENLLILRETPPGESFSGEATEDALLETMVRAALERFPEARLIVRYDPAYTPSRTFWNLLEQAGDRVEVLPESVDIGALCSRADRVFTGNGMGGFEALIRGRTVHCFAPAWYGGWGVTEDEVPQGTRLTRRDRTEIAAACLLRQTRWVDDRSGQETSPEAVCDRLVQIRSGFAAQRHQRNAQGFKGGQAKTVLFELSNMDAGLDAFKSVVEAIRRKAPGTQCVVFDFSKVFRNPSDKDTLRTVFDEVYTLTDALQIYEKSGKRKKNKVLLRLATPILDTWFKEVSPSAVILSNDRAFLELRLVKIAEARGVPSLLLQESIRRDQAFPGATPDGIHHGGAGCDRLLAWGPEGAAYFRAIGVPEERIVITGSSRMDNLVQGFADLNQAEIRDRFRLGQNHRIALLTTSPMHLISEMSEDEYVDAIKACIDCADELQQEGAKVHLLVKHHRTEEKFFNKHGLVKYANRPRASRYVNDMTIGEAIAASDCILNFSSTVAVEASLVGKPVGIVRLVDRNYGVDYSAQGISIDLTSKPAIKSFVKNGRFAGAEVQERLRHYVAHPGRAAERIADAILEVADERLRTRKAELKAVNRSREARKGDANPRVLVVVNFSHTTKEESNFLEEATALLNREGWRVIEIGVREYPISQLRDVAQLRNRFEECAKLDVPWDQPGNPPWVNGAFIDLQVQWEQQRHQDQRDPKKARKGAKVMAQFVDNALRTLQPDQVITFNKFDPVCAYFYRAAKHYQVPVTMLERSPIGGFWPEPTGYYGDSIVPTVWEQQQQDLSRDEQSLGAKYVSRMAKFPSNFRKIRQMPRHEKMIRELAHRKDALFFLPFDNAVATHLTQPGHPEKPIDYPVFEDHWDALKKIRDAVRQVGGRLVVKTHPSDKIITPETLPKDILFYDGDLRPILQTCDAVIVMNTQVAFAAVAVGKPVVSLTPNPVIASGSTYHATRIEDIVPTLEAALAQRDHGEKLERFNRLMAVLGTRYFYTLSDFDNIYSRGPRTWVADFLGQHPRTVKTDGLTPWDLDKAVKDVRRQTHVRRPKKKTTSTEQREQPRIMGIQPAVAGFTVNPYYGGKDIACYAVTREAVRAGFDYYILAYGGRENYFDEFPYSVGISGAHATVLPTCYIPNDETMLKYKKEELPSRLLGMLKNKERVIVKAMERVRPDIVHNHYTHRNFSKIYRENDMKTKLILTHHSPDISAYLDLYDLIVFLSNTHKQAICAENPAIEDRARVIYWDVSPEYMIPHDAYQPDGPVLFMASLRDQNPIRKGLDLLLGAYEKHRKLNERELIIVGEGPSRAEWAERAREKNLNISFKGWVPTDEVAELMKSCGLFVLPSREEGFGIVYLEALCMGLPVLGIPDTIADLEDYLKLEVGYSYDAVSGNIDELADLIHFALFEDKRFDKPKRRVLQQTARNHFYPGHAGQEYVKLYHELLSS